MSVPPPFLPLPPTAARDDNVGRRWIRLLFGREFPLSELLEVWDSLFAEDPDLQLVDYICVAMLLRIRWPRPSPPPPSLLLRLEKCRTD